MEQLVSAQVADVEDKIEATQKAVETIIENVKDTSGIEKVEMQQMNQGVQYLRSKSVSLEERAMYADLDLHEALRMLSILMHEYDDGRADLEWFGQIVLRELCKLEKRTREEVLIKHLEILGSPKSQDALVDLYNWLGAS